MKSYKLACVSILSSVFLLFPFSNTFGQQGSRSTISGFVFDDARRPLPQVVVELKGEFSTLGRVKTDGSGRYFFGGLPQGRYTVRAMPLGTPFAEQSEDIEIAGLGVLGQLLAENVQKDIYLKPRKASNSARLQNTVVFAQEVPKPAEALYKQAVSDLDGQRIQLGVENLEKAINTFPNYFDALQRLGGVWLSQGRFDEASVVFAKAVTVNDRCFDCWFGQSYSQYSIRKYPESVISGEKATALKPDSMEANLLLGMAYRSTKNFPKSETFLKHASKISDGSSADVHWHLALLYGKDLNRFADAAKELEAFLRLSPDAPNKDALKKLIAQFKEKAKND